MRDALQLIGLSVVAGAVYFAQHEWRREEPEPPPPVIEAPPAPEAPRPYRFVHVYVALCDNQHQGIVPVPEQLGNGQDPDGNLYWGARYGVRTFLDRSPHWKRAVIAPPGLHDDPALRGRVVFVLDGPTPVYLVAEAYDGAHMETALRNFFEAAAGRRHACFGLLVDGVKKVVEAEGEADLIAFVGHNGLMDVSVVPEGAPADRKGPQAAVVLACKSADYFEAPLRAVGCPLLVGTTNFMAPEAYTLDAIVRGWAAGETEERVRKAAGDAYAKYQRCDPDAALRLFASRTNTR